MTAPVRVKLSRARGWRKPPNTVVVSRPSKWGNPFSVSCEGREWSVVSRLPKDPIIVWKCDTRDGAITKAVELFREALIIGDLGYEPYDVRQELAGKNLACWCAHGSQCHADVLLEIAKGGTQ